MMKLVASAREGGMSSVGNVWQSPPAVAVDTCIIHLIFVYFERAVAAVSRAEHRLLQGRTVLSAFQTRQQAARGRTFTAPHMH